MEATVNTKLTINLRDGILDVDGSEEFVRSIYEDFKGEVAKRVSSPATASRQIEAPAIPVQDADEIVGKDKPKKQRTKRVTTTTGEGPKVRTGKYKPTFDSTLNVKGLPKYYDSMNPYNAAEKILTFAAFLRDSLKMESCTADHIYTCFFAVKDRTKIPEAFEQAFRDMRWSRLSEQILRVDKWSVCRG